MSEDIDKADKAKKQADEALRQVLKEVRRHKEPTPVFEGINGFTIFGPNNETSTIYPETIKTPPSPIAIPSPRPYQHEMMSMQQDHYDGDKPVLVIDDAHGCLQYGGYVSYDVGAELKDQDGNVLTSEKDRLNDFLPFLIAEAHANGYEVRITNSANCNDPLEQHFQDRIDLARNIAEKENKAVMFLSPHVNMDQDPRAKGPRIYSHINAPRDSFSRQWALDIAEAMGIPERYAQKREYAVLQPNIHTSISKPERWSVTNGLGSIPATLFELGFLSNSEDKANLQDPKHLEQLAKQVIAGTNKTYDALQEKNTHLPERAPVADIDKTQRLPVIDTASTGIEANVIPGGVSAAQQRDGHSHEKS